MRFRANGQKSKVIELFPEFMDDPEQYDRAEEYWESMWRSLVRKVRPAGPWKSPWLNVYFGNGKKMRDSNPIFSAVCKRRRLGVRILQIEPGEGPEFEYDLDTFAKDDPEMVNVLTVRCALTEEIARKAAALMTEWMIAGRLDSPAAYTKS